jgi:hypothetical protein
MSMNTGTAPRSTKALAVEDERERGHDRLVVRLQVEEQRRHVQRSRCALTRL